MKTEDGDEIVEPGTYRLEDDKTLHIFITGNEDAGYKLWACMAYDHGPMCRLCQEIGGVSNACLVNVIDGRMTCRQDADGQFHFKMTKAGTDAVANMINRGDFDD